MEIVETHAHLDFSAFDADRPAVVERARSAGVKAIVNVALHPGIAGRTIALAETYPEIYTAVGVHPHVAGEYAGRVDEAVEALRALAAHPRVVAVGEMGLDFFRDYAPPEEQEAVFAAQIELARELGRPAIIHCRAADGQVLDRLATTRPPSVLMHCFSMDEAAARQCAERGYYIGVGGVLTFPNADGLRRIVRAYPRERVVLETDCPFLAPQSRRGRRNEPAYLVWVAEALAKLWNVGVEEAAALTAENARALFGLPRSNPAVQDERGSRA